MPPKIYRMFVYTVYRQGRYSRAVDLWIRATDGAMGLRRAKKSKEMWTKKHCPRAVELEK